ncbi:MAG: TonB-dependent receptor [Rhodanobacteraceae bacterium]|nr:MAG: TonB-dependent receptor [Rhodanobacteraceae bacterium]
MVPPARSQTAPATQPPTTAATHKPPQVLQTIIVTGTRAFDRTLAQSMKPVDVLTPADLNGTGATNLSNALRILLPSFNFPQTTDDDASQATIPAQLRGLSPDETLVLINGKRQHTTAIANITGSVGQGTSPVDLAAIPINAIQRIEVLRDGAAAQYGSDAIAGVINIILKGGASHHGEVAVTRGVHGGMQGQTWSGAADTGFDLGQNGWAHVSVNYLNQDPTNHAGPDGRFPGDPSFDKVTSHFGLPRELQRQAAFNAQYDLGENAALYAFGVYSKRDVDGYGFFRNLAQYQTTDPAGAAVFPDGFLPAENYTVLDTTTVVGLRGDWNGWHYDISADTGSNHNKQYDTHDLNFSLGAASPTAFYVGTLTLRQDVLNADFSRNFDVGWDGPLNVAWGLAYRHARFTIKPGDPASYAGAGAQSFPGYQPQDAGSHSRTNVAEYVDLETNFTHRFSGELAARHEHYSDFGNTTSWEVSGRYAFTPLIALRGTASTGFRAPSLQQEFYSNTTDELIPVAGGGEQFFVTRTFPVSNPAAAALGAQPLQPERSHNYSVGLVFTPKVGPYITLDAYQVNISNRIILSGDLVGPAVQAFLTSAGFPFVEGGRFFTNAVSTRTRGLDLIGTWPVRWMGSELKFTGGLNYDKTEIRSIRPNPPQLGLAGLKLPVINRTEQGRITVNAPKTKAFVAATWQRGRWTARSQLTRYGKFTQLDPTPADDQTYGARLLLNASVSYTLARWRFTLGGDNITNTYPEKNNAANAFFGIDRYPSISPFGFNGAYWYATMAYRW